MSRTLLASTLFAWALLPVPAQAETWCLKSFGQERGVCEREQLGNSKPATRRSSMQR